MRLSCLANLTFWSLATAAAIKTQDASFTSLAIRQDMPDQPSVSGSCFNPQSRPVSESVYDCEPKVKTKDDGTCQLFWNENDRPRCDSYCEKRLFYEYGAEQPYKISACRAGSECVLMAEQQVSITKTITFNAGLSVEAFNFGASVSWSRQVLSGNRITLPKPEKNKDDCGYWTFVPFYVTSCGVRTYGEAKNSQFGSAWSCKNVQTVQEVCQSAFYVNEAGDAGGVAVFVATDCTTNKKLPFCKQDPIYLRAGVSDDPSVHRDWVMAHWNEDLNLGILGTAQVQCEKGNWPPPE